MNIAERQKSSDVARKETPMNQKTLARAVIIMLVLALCLAPQRGGAQVLLRREVDSFGANKSQTTLAGRDNPIPQLLTKLHTANQASRNFNASQIITIPYWTGSFNYHGISYSYRMVGTDPSLGSATTVVPTVIIPLRFVFADGSVEDVGTELFEGQTAAAALANSPIFNPYTFNVQGVMVGNTPYPDAFQRANFWNFVSSRSKDYHVLLAAPLILPSQTINVPADKGQSGPNPGDNVVDFVYLDQQVQSLIGQLNLSSRSLPIFLTGNTTEGFSLGYHSVFGAPVAGSSKIAVQTYVVACYLGQTSGFSAAEGQDVFPVTHEINEWLDDPFVDNFTPGWDLLIDNDIQCDSDLFFGNDVLEVGDAIAALPNRGSIPLATSPYVYHLQDCLFLDFFRRSSPSSAAAGQYSFFASATAPAVPCTGHLEVNFTTFAIPGSTDTIGHSINNRGDIVGDYHDLNGIRHGFLIQKGQYTTIDPPNAIFTFAMRINDAGVIVGLYYTPDFFEHGFSYKNGQFTQLDFPGSSFTEANGINSRGDIVGDYVDNNGIQHGFILSHGGYQNVDAPGAVNTVLFSVNDFSLMTGFTYADSFSPFLSFLRLGSAYTNAQYPGSFDTENLCINNAGTFGGVFDDSFFYSDGFVNLFGYYYDIYAAVYGVNDVGQIVGYRFGDTGLVGVLGQLPVTPAKP